MTPLYKKLQTASFVAYDFYDKLYPLYFESLDEFCSTYHLAKKDLIERFNKTNDNYIYFKTNGSLYKLYYFL